MAAITTDTTASWRVARAAAVTIDRLGTMPVRRATAAAITTSVTMETASGTPTSSRMGLTSRRWLAWRPETTAGDGMAPSWAFPRAANGWRLRVRDLS
jgi:hypothetical protein